jgi:hypothetical protein
MTAHARLVFHECIRLQLRHLIGVTGVACAKRRYGREVLCCCLAMAHGAFHTVGAMRAGFPLVPHCLVAAGTGIPGWNQPMDNVLGLILLSIGRLDGNSQNEKNEQGETEQAGTDTIHGQTPEYGLQVSNRRWLQSVIHITFHRNAICALDPMYGPPHECKGTLRTTGAVCVYVFGLQMEIILLATMSSARACSN